MVTGCQMLRSRVWGTQSAKLYVSESSVESLAKDQFWPEHISYRPWERIPPGVRGNGNVGTPQHQI